MNQPGFLLKDNEIGHYSGYRTRVSARYFFELTSEDDLPKLMEIYAYARTQDLRLLIISWGTNILFATDIFEWIIIKNSLVWWEYNEEEKILHAFSNESIWQIAESLENQYNNPLWHRFIGLPGSIGWALYGNAGCFGLETESNFSRASVYDMSEWKRKNLSKDEMQFTYRYSVLKRHPEYFLVWACFDLSEKIEKYPSDVDNISFREHKQPKGNSCGSFWKNPSREVSAGQLIESVGLKWYRHGWAYWSDLHANFLMSDDETCKGRDLYELIELTRKKVKEEKGITLENEVKIII